ncbi:MAG TPA: isoaspartyl peptidase/L-asparaginase [Polyangia bacterium]|nr:isoaspartyl peptidase/L-asparaginase [Polyangia bacterium]
MAAGPATGGLSLMVHGGAGSIDQNDPDGAAHVAGCRAAARAGYAVLKAGGSAVDAVVAAVTALEDDGVFNAGTGSALTEAGEVECDASVMSGAGAAGAVGALRDIKNPVRLARLVMERTSHVLLVGPGAEAFAAEQGVKGLAAGALVTERARARWQEALAKRRAPSGHGTVGCVARDGQGQVAAATSTGGMVLKHAGRVGDSALIGAGTYADDRAGAASCTGLGEAFMKAAGAKIAVEAMLAGAPPDAAARQALAAVRRYGGDGGIICVDATGRLGFAFNTRGMSRASISTAGVESSGV